MEIFLRDGFAISEAEGQKGYAAPRRLHNDGYGDQQEKAPDIRAYDAKNQQHILGEAKTGSADLETDHALTQYNVFLDQEDKRTVPTFHIVHHGTADLNCWWIRCPDLIDQKHYNSGRR